MKQSYDFTAGPIGRPLLLYTLPLLLANVLQSFYQLVDLLVVGRIVGETGLAAISSASTVCFLITSLGTGLTTGGMVRVAQQAGAKDTTGLEETAGTLFSASLVVSLLVAVAGALTAPCLLQLLSVPSEAMTDASAYLRVLCLARLSPSVTWPTLPSAREQGTPKSPFSASRRPPPSTSCWTFSWWASWPWEPWARPTPQWPLREPPFCCPSPWAEGRMGRFPAAPASRSAASPWPPLSKLACPRPFK